MPPRLCIPAVTLNFNKIYLFVFILQIETSRPKKKKRYRQNVELEVRDMNRQMPQPIQPNRVLDLLPDVEMMQRGLFQDEEPPDVAQSEMESKAETYDTVRLTK